MNAYFGSYEVLSIAKLTSIVHIALCIIVCQWLPTRKNVCRS